MKIKLVTLNILHGGEMLEKAIAFLKQEDPDILFLQEAQAVDYKSEVRHFNTISEITQNLAFPYVLFEPHSEVQIKSDIVKHGNAIFSKYKLESRGLQFFDVPFGRFDYEANKKSGDFSQIPQSLLCAVATIERKKLFLFNCHGIWGPHGGDTDRRLQMIRIIMEEIKDKKPAILAGDFNMKPDTQAIRSITDILKSVFGTRLKSTFNMKLKTDPGYATAAVDMVFVSPDIKVLSSSCPDVEISDHLPLVVELEL